MYYFSKDFEVPFPVLISSKAKIGTKCFCEFFQNKDIPTRPTKYKPNYFLNRMFDEENLFVGAVFFHECGFGENRKKYTIKRRSTT